MNDGDYQPDMDIRPIEGEVFEYGLADDGVAAGGSMHSYVSLPGAVDTDELIDTIGAARADLEGYGVTRSTHGVPSYDLSGTGPSGQEPLYERITFQKLHGGDREPVPPRRYVEAMREGTDAGLTVDEWNVYVRLDGDTDGFYMDSFSREQEEPVFDAVVDAVSGVVDTDAGIEEDTGGVLPLDDLMFENASTGELYGHVSLPEPMDPDAVADVVEDVMEDMDGYSVSRTPLGTRTYAIDAGEPLRTLDEAAVEQVRARRDRDAVAGGVTTGTVEPIDRWAAYIEQDDVVSGFLVDRFSIDVDDGVFQGLIDGLREELW